MSSPTGAGLASKDAIQEAIQRILFPENSDEPALNAYAILDGAAIPDLLDHLYGDEPPEFMCLYAGELEPDMAECAPYLVELKSGTPFTTWLISQGWGKSWGIFATSTEEIDVLRRHFRNFLMVKNPEGQTLYFRYYDPRVFSVYLPTANAEECETIFGPVTAFYCESEHDGIVAFGWSDGELKSMSYLSADHQNAGR